MDDDVKQLLDAIRLENSAGHSATQRRTEALVTDARQHTEALVAETRNHAESLAAETRRHFEIVAGRVEKKVETLAETVAHLDQKLDAETARIRDEMRRGFSETQAMIKFSHAELDRRVRALEDTHNSLEESIAQLQARVERLESGTH